MRRFKIIGKGYKEVIYSWKKVKSEIIVLLDTKTKREVMLEHEITILPYGSYCDIEDRIYISVDYSIIKIVYDLKEREIRYNIYPNTRGTRRKAFASIAKNLGISKKELAMYMGLVSLFDKH